MRSLILLWLLSLLGCGAAWLLWPVQHPSPVPVAAGSEGATATVQLGEAQAGGAPKLVSEAAPAASAEREDVVVAPSVTGRLLQQGEPLAGVTLFACSGSSWQAEELDRAVTNDQGAFQLSKVGKTFWLTAEGDQVPHNWKTNWLRTADGPFDVEVALPGSITGVVCDQDGAGIAGAVLTHVVSPFDSVHFRAMVARVVESDARGRFVLPRVAAEQGQLRCTADGYAVVPEHHVDIAAGEHVTTKIVMKRGETLRGLVLDHVGRPLPAAMITSEDGHKVETDALGQFSMPHFRSWADVTIAAQGHLPREVANVHQLRELLQVKLERAVTLRGKVLGCEQQPGTVYVEPGSNPWPGASNTLSYDAVYELLDIVRDGSFELPGLAMTDYQVTVRIPGVGVAGPVRVEMRDDLEVEFEVVPQRDVQVFVRDAFGKPVANASLIRDDGVVAYPDRYRQEGESLIQLVRRSYKKRQPVQVSDGQIVLGVPKGEGLAFLVEAPGHLRVARATLSDALPDRIDVVLPLAGGVRGTVRGGMRGAYNAYVAITAVGQAPGDAAQKPFTSVAIGRTGSFVIDNVPPGNYRARILRSNRASIKSNSGGMPLLDGGEDLRGSTNFVVEAGRVTEIELVEPELGRLTGRVLLRGVPIVGAMIVASRPESGPDASAAQRRISGRDGGIDWDDELELKYASGQLSAVGGAYTFLYREAGEVEVRVRHASGASTSLPVVIHLPPPGADVVRDIEIPSGEIRGRYPIDLLDQVGRDTLVVTLFPGSKALDDPFFLPSHGLLNLAYECAKVEKPTDGRFAFPFLRPGRWLLRVHHLGSVLLWQGMVEVHRDLVDLGELPRVATVAAPLRWQWQGERKGKVTGVWLRAQLQDGQEPVWAGTFRAEQDRVTCTVAPGRYLLVPFGWRAAEGDEAPTIRGLGMGLTGEALADPVPVEIRSDGTVVPNPIEFSPLPDPANPK